MHVQIIEALGSLTRPPGVDAHTARPFCTAANGGRRSGPAALRQAAAAALRRIGSPETLAVLEEAAARGSRGVRNGGTALPAVIHWPASEAT